MSGSILQISMGISRMSGNAFPISIPTSDHLRSDFSISKTASGNMYKLYFLHL